MSEGNNKPRAKIWVAVAIVAVIGVVVALLVSSTAAGRPGAAEAAGAATDRE